MNIIITKRCIKKQKKFLPKGKNWKKKKKEEEEEEEYPGCHSFSVFVCLPHRYNLAILSQEMEMLVSDINQALAYAIPLPHFPNLKLLSKRFRYI